MNNVPVDNLLMLADAAGDHAIDAGHAPRQVPGRQAPAAAPVQVIR
jgi:hypothetical protein